MRAWVEMRARMEENESESEDEGEGEDLTLRPRRELNVAQPGSVLLSPQLKSIAI